MVRHIQWATLCVALMLVACSSTATTTVVPTLTPTDSQPAYTPQPAATRLHPNKLGIHMLLDDGRNVWPLAIWAQHLGYARDLVGEWGYVTELVT
jgi:hypothetical protein